MIEVLRKWGNKEKGRKEHLELRHKDSGYSEN